MNLYIPHRYGDMLPVKYQHYKPKFLDMLDFTTRTCKEIGSWKKGKRLVDIVGETLYIPMPDDWITGSSLFIHTHPMTSCVKNRLEIEFSTWLDKNFGNIFSETDILYSYESNIKNAILLFRDGTTNYARIFEHINDEERMRRGLWTVKEIGNLYLNMDIDEELIKNELNDLTPLYTF